MATNQARYVGNLQGLPAPTLGAGMTLGLFQAGATQAVKRGEILEKTAGGATQWVPMDSDFNMDKDVAIAAEEIKSGYLSGYYLIYTIRPGDVWEFEKAAAGADAYGTALYWSSSEKVTITAGTNILGHIAGTSGLYPGPQGHAADDASPDKGTTLTSQLRCHMTFATSNCFHLFLQGT